ncbi:MAG: O-antigen ligase family protein [Sedimentisphaerales bacterium]|nr:O-antigen ligase family protein [Sedimentisphaerales bacterium]
MKTSSMTFSPSESVAEIAFLALCAFSIVNPLIAQFTSFFFPHTIAGLNMMQWFQGLCLPLILVTLPKLPRDNDEFSPLFSRLLWVYVISLGLLHLRLLSTNRLQADMVNVERMVYFKMIFAFLLWYYASCLVRSYESAQKLLRSILIGALICAAWILICYLTGMGSANYASAGVKATAGSEGISGKAMAGFLLPAAVGAMFLALQEHSYRWAMGAALIVVAVFITFDRSAHVAFIIGSLWLAIWWWILACPRPCLKTMLLFLCIIFILGGLYYIQHGNEELVTRWTYDFDRGEIGSGRGIFYTTAWTWFWKDSSVVDFLLGMGFGNIYDLMHSRSGIFRHTHSDLFDMLVIGGVVGLSLYFLMFYTITSLWKGVRIGSIEFAILGALLLSFGVMSLLTGLMSFPHTLYAFGAQCICIRILANQENLDPAPSLSICQVESINADVLNGQFTHTNALLS